MKAPFNSALRLRTAPTIAHKIYEALCRSATLSVKKIQFSTNVVLKSLIAEE